MKEIKSFALDKIFIPGKKTGVSYTVNADPGSVFSMVITNKDADFYNFPENTIVSIEENINTPAGSFSSTPAKLSQQEVDESGIYHGLIDFPKVTSDDDYYIVLYAEAFFNTTFNKTISNGLVYFDNISQKVDTSLTFSLLSAANDSTYSAYPSDVVVTGVSTQVSNAAKNKTFSISWPVTLSSSQFIIAKQPSLSDFYISTTKDTLNAGSGTSLELKDISGLSFAMKVTGTGIASGATIIDIIPGYKDINKSTAANPFYVIPKATSSANNCVRIF